MNPQTSTILMPNGKLFLIKSNQNLLDHEGNFKRPLKQPAWKGRSSQDALPSKHNNISMIPNKIIPV